MSLILCQSTHVVFNAYLSIYSFTKTFNFNGESILSVILDSFDS